MLKAFHFKLGELFCFVLFRFSGQVLSQALDGGVSGQRKEEHPLGVLTMLWGVTLRGCSIGFLDGLQFYTLVTSLFMHTLLKCLFLL